jgi:hypothetical protein
MLCSRAPESDPDKLEALRRLDQFREWRTLDDQRYCLVCGKIITGREIQVAGDMRGQGQLQLSCPTEQCNSIPMDWVLLTDEIVALAATAAAKDRSVIPPTAPDRGPAQNSPFELDKSALQFNQAS